jgi:hypothetical protein
VAANSDATEKAAYAKASRKKAARDAAALRAVNTKDYLVTEKGIDASRVRGLHRLQRQPDGGYDLDPRGRSIGHDRSDPGG